MCFRVPLAAGVVLAALCPAVATAEPITLVGYGTHLYAQTLVYGSQGFVAVYDQDRQLNAANSASSASQFNGTTALAESSLTSVLSADLHRLSAFATSSASVTGSRGGSQTVADVDFSFDLAQPHAFSFLGDFSADGRGSWQAHLHQERAVGEQVLRFTATSNTDQTQYLQFHGSLDPGRYRLFVRGGASADTVFSNTPSGLANYNFAFDMTPVPEPGSMLLVASGVIGLLARRRRAAKER